ncbi:hypothetical protein CM19_00815 [Candidatus Acidianus copahuensis]|uniref:Uncharacterized protein n=1 Tax=Candidatus Acidianus copahuensis TaxID=1160895 RepID=A0A031LWM6_9CREN|nr:PqqD family protein [Candidatus Acidianus copahuensis]EZQ11543.1 hypothetical protein CM19_00815 [Candidatus Acidianus copahuensis]
MGEITESKTLIIKGLGKYVPPRIVIIPTCTAMNSDIIPIWGMKGNWSEISSMEYKISEIDLDSTTKKIKIKVPLYKYRNLMFIFPSYVANETGTLILEELANGESVSKIVTNLSVKYSIDKETVREDIIDFIKQLTDLEVLGVINNE